MTETLRDLTESAAAILRSPPDAPDGYYDWQINDGALSRDRGITNRIIERLEPFTSAAPKPQVGAKVLAAADQILHWQTENDRLGAFEDILSVMSMQPKGSKLGGFLQDKAIGTLYNAIPHPPTAYLSDKYTFREADGSHNNIHEPDIGKSGTPYARSVQPKKVTHPSSLPDPGLVFDTLLKARDRVDHKGGNSALTFAFATLVTHSLFSTDHSDQNINNASSYLDLSPLYGNDAPQVESVRDFSQASLGKGLLQPDVFADGNLNFLPPAACALLVIFNRNHNYIADMLLKLNEKKKWTNAPVALAALAAADKKKQDEQIFQTARLINCGHFISIIMNDYVAGFLGLSEGNAWSMNAFDPIKFRDGQTVKRGEGNHVSVEFNLLYRWHTTVSAADEAWTKESFANIEGLKGKDIETMDVPTFVQGLLGDLGKLNGLKPNERTFTGLQRGPDGKFADTDIARLLQDATESPAGQYRARGTPSILRPIEMLGIVQARRWGVCTMNEFRSFMGLKQFASFEEWNPDPEIAQAARHLYGHIDNLELYTGLQAEQHMALSPGLRFSCGYTMTRAVLSDAIALVRGDRYYSTSYSPVHLTAWGFHDATTRPENGAFGGHLQKLLFRHLPRHYPYNSVYAIFPFFTPKKMEETLKRLGKEKNYDFVKPKPPAPPFPVFLDNFQAIDFVFNDPARFVSGYNMSGLGDGWGFMMAIDQGPRHDREKELARNATFENNTLYQEYVQWYRESLMKEIKEQSWRGGDGRYYVDIWQVVKTVHIFWAAEKLCGISLKTKDNPRGRYTVDEVFDLFADLFTATFLGLGDTERLFTLVQKARIASDIIQGAVRESVKRVKVASSSSADAKKDDKKEKEDRLTEGINTLKGWYREVETYVWSPEEKPWFQFISRLDADGTRQVNELVANIVGLANGSSVNQAQSMLNVIDFYLDRKDEWATIQQLITKNDAESDELLKGYIKEAMRLNPQFTGLWRVATVETDIPNTSIKVVPGQRIWGGFKLAHRNPVDFPNPDVVQPNRDPSKYQLNGGGFHLCIGVEFAVQVITDSLKIIYGLKNVGRAPGEAGRMPQTTKIINAVSTNQYIKADGSLTDWPVRMLLAFDL